MLRDMLHHLIDRLPEPELPAQHYLESLITSPAVRAALLAPPDDEPVTQADADAIARAEADVEAGRVIPHDEILREFGLR